MLISSSPHLEREQQSPTHLLPRQFCVTYHCSWRQEGSGHPWGPPAASHDRAREGEGRSRRHGWLSLCLERWTLWRYKKWSNNPLLLPLPHPQLHLRVSGGGWTCYGIEVSSPLSKTSRRLSSLLRLFSHLLLHRCLMGLALGSLTNAAAVWSECEMRCGR